MTTTQKSAADNHLSENSSLKEREPLAKRFEVQEIQIAGEYKPDPEVKKYLKKPEENIKIPNELKKIGVCATSGSQKYETIISLPISNNLILKGLHAPVSSSLRWLAEQAMYLLKKAHLTLKKVHGQVVKTCLPNRQVVKK